MPIQRSASNAVARLLTQLEHDDSSRETAVARLTIIGTRAVPQLIASATSDASTLARTGALEALAAIDEARVLTAIVCLVDADDVEVAAAAIEALQTRLESPRHRMAATAVHHLTAVVLDQVRSDAIRVAALDALASQSGSALEAVRARLRDDPSPAVRRRVTDGPSPPRGHDELAAVGAGRRVNHPVVVRRLLERGGRTAPLATLHRVVAVLREKELAARSDKRQDAWRTTRATAHQILAARRSRVALSDLHDTLKNAAQPLPDGFLVAASGIGDVACLEALAAAYATSHEPIVGIWRRQLADTFLDIVRREHLTRRHRELRRVLARWPAIDHALPARL